MNQRQLGDLLRGRRSELGLDQRSLAELARVAQHTVSNLETGRGNPTVRFLQKLAAAFDTTLEINFRPLAN